MKPLFIQIPALLFLVFLSACANVPSAKPLPLPPPPETATAEETPAPRLPEGIRLQSEGRELTLAELESGTLPANATITVRAERDVSYEVISGMLKKIHDLGYLVHFPTTD